MEEHNFNFDFSLLSDWDTTRLDAAGIRVSKASIAEALASCQSALSQMNATQINDEVREIEKSFSSGDFPEKVISFVNNKKRFKQQQSYFKEQQEDWDISACTKEDCPHRQECNLNFTSFEICIWSIIHCRLNKSQELMEIIEEIALYMKKADKELEDRLENKSF